MPYKTLLVLILVGAAVYYFYPRSQQPPIPLIPFTADTLPGTELRSNMEFRPSIDTHPCAQRTQCLVLYLAPWCPSCRSTVSFVPAMRDAIEQHPSAGFMLVVGKAWGNFNGVENMIQQLGGTVYLDPDAKLWNGIKHATNAVPTWMVVDGEGYITKTHTGSPQQQDKNSAEAFLKKLEIY